MNEILTILLVLIVVALIFMMASNMYEGFDSNTTEFVPVGAPRHGLRGDRLYTHDISANFLPENRLIRLSHSGGQMWEADGTVSGQKGCKSVPCPHGTDFYSKGDTCMTCDDGSVDRMEMPGFNYHAKI